MSNPIPDSPLDVIFHNQSSIKLFKGLANGSNGKCMSNVCKESGIKTYSYTVLLIRFWEKYGVIRTEILRDCPRKMGDTRSRRVRKVWITPLGRDLLHQINTLEVMLENLSRRRK